LIYVISIVMRHFAYVTCNKVKEYKCKLRLHFEKQEAILISTAS